MTQFQSLAEQRTNAHQQEVEDLQRSLVDQAVHDDITDLFTPRFFEEHLTVEVKRAARYQRAFALIIVDIDHFEEYHARYGTLAASAALKITADALREFTRDLDVKARTDETEFGLAMPETSLEAAFMVAERIRLEIAAASPVERRRHGGRVDRLHRPWRVSHAWRNRARADAVGAAGSGSGSTTRRQYGHASGSGHGLERSAAASSAVGVSWYSYRRTRS